MSNNGLSRLQKSCLVMLILLIPRPAAVYPQASGCLPVPEDLIAWWPGDGNAVDVEGGRDGTPQNGATFAPGLVDQAFSLDGVDDYVLLPDSVAWNFGSEDFTVDFWALSSQSDNRMHPISFEPLYGTRNLDFDFNDPSLLGGLWVYWNSSGTNRITVGAQNAYTDGQWHLIALTRNGATLTLYVDGLAAGSSTYSEPIDLSSSAINYIGAGQGGHLTPQFFWNGLIDEVEIFKRALSASEIRAIYNAGSAGKCKGPSFRLPFVGPRDITNGPTCGSQGLKHENFTQEAIDYGLFYENVYATEDGDIIFAGSVPPGPKPNLSGFGTFIVIRHDDGSQSYYAHLSQALVTSGRVAKGQLIAISGESGKAKGHPHLHFQIMDSQGGPISIRTLPGTTWSSGDPNDPCQKKKVKDGIAVGPPVP